MNHSLYIWTGIFIMFLSTYLVRVLPMVLIKRKIQSRFIRSFLYYVPYVVLTAMTFPAIFYSTNSMLSAAGGTLAALLLAFAGRSLVTVALCAAAVVCVLQCFGI